MQNLTNDEASPLKFNFNLLCLPRFAKIVKAVTFENHFLKSKCAVGTIFFITLQSEAKQSY